MAANPSPAFLPTSTAPPHYPQISSSSNSTARAFLTTLFDNIRFSLANRRPWLELADRSAFSKPESISEATLRLRKNYNYFRTNYLTIITAVLAISLLSHPFTLFLLAALLAAWLFLYVFRQSSDPPIVLFGRQFSDRESLLFLILSTVGVIFLTSVGSVLVSALMIGVAIVSLHGAFRAPEDMFINEQEPQGGVPGFLTLLSGGAAAAAAAKQPPSAAARPPPTAAARPPPTAARA